MCGSARERGSVRTRFWNGRLVNGRLVNGRLVNGRLGAAPSEASAFDDGQMEGP